MVDNASIATKSALVSASGFAFAGTEIERVGLFLLAYLYLSTCDIFTVAVYRLARAVLLARCPTT